MRGVVRLVVLQRGDVERVERGETVSRPVELGDGDRAVERDDRVRTQCVEVVVERDVLGPVGASAVAASACTAAIAAWIWNGRAVVRRHACTSVVPFRDQGSVPSRAVLVGEPDQRPVGRGAGRLSGFGEQHQGEQADGFGLVGHELDEDLAEPDRLAREVDAGEASPVLAVCPSV